MPSEDLVQRALDALAGPREAFRSAVTAAVAEIGARIEAQRVHPEGRVERMTHELGTFAAGRIDGGRFAAVFASGSALSPGMLGRLEQAHERLRWIAERGGEQLVVRVAPGGDVRSAVARALAEIGGAFAAARDAEMARTGRPSNGGPGDTAGWFPFRRWNRAERQAAPPLVIEVDGGDAQALALAEFLDGGQKLVLVLRGPAPAAPLARLATPGVFVMQTRDPAELAELSNVVGPAIAALVPQGCAEFVHRPGVEESSARFEVKHIPSESPRSVVGSFGVLQQAEDLAYLKAATASPAPAAPALAQATEPANGATAPAPAAAAAAVVVEPADRLAAWLLSQADLNGAG